jgi:hypothetical protein
VQIGDVIRYGPNRLLTLRPPDVNSRLIYTSPQPQPETNVSLAIYGYGPTFRKAQSYAAMIPWKDGWSSATSIDKNLHRALRSTMLLGFSPASLKKFEPAILKNLETYFSKLLHGRPENGGWALAKDMNKWSIRPPWIFFSTVAPN